MLGWISRWKQQIKEIIHSDSPEHRSYQESPPILHKTEFPTKEDQYREHDRQYKNRQITANTWIILATLAAAGGSIWQGYLTRQALTESKANSIVATGQVWSAVSNLNWMAKNTDASLQKLSQQASDTHDLADAAKSAADAAKSEASTAVSGLRPWIKIIDVETSGEGPEIPALSFQQPATWPPERSQATFQLKISLKNVGRSPAKMTVGFELFLPVWKNGYSDAIYREKEQFCGKFSKNGTAKEPSLQRMLFPEEPYDWYGGGVAIVDAKSVNYLSNAPQTTKYILLAVAVCANYQFGDSSSVHQTSALYEVFRKDDRSRFFEVNRGVPASGIFLIRNEASDNAY